MHLEGTGINPTPVDLHEQQLSLEQHSQAHRITTLGLQQRTRLSPSASVGPAGVHKPVRTFSPGLMWRHVAPQERRQRISQSLASSPSEA